MTFKIVNMIPPLKRRSVKSWFLKPFSCEEKGWDEVKRCKFLQKKPQFYLTLNPSPEKGEGLLERLVIKFIGILFLALVACQPKEQTQKENLPYYNTADFTPNWYTENQLDTLKLHKISDFSFIDQEGKKVSNETVKGKIYLANFFFTICPSICPTMTQNLLAVHNTFKNDADILMLSHSVMPATDTVAQLKKYANRWKIDSQRWHLLTGEKDKIYALARQSYFAEKEIGLQKDKNEFLHTENVFLIDKNGYIRGVYNATLPLDVENLVKDIKVLKSTE